MQFSATQQTQRLRIRIINNNIVENNELFELRLTAAGLLAVGDREVATVNITDDEGMLHCYVVFVSSLFTLCVDVIVQFNSSMYTATEASGVMEVGLMFSGGIFDRELTISVTTTEQTATGIIVLIHSDIRNS